MTVRCLRDTQQQPAARPPTCSHLMVKPTRESFPDPPATNISNQSNKHDHKHSFEVYAHSLWSFALIRTLRDKNPPSQHQLNRRLTPEPWWKAVSPRSFSRQSAAFQRLVASSVREGRLPRNGHRLQCPAVGSECACSRCLHSQSMPAAAMLFVASGQYKPCASPPFLGAKTPRLRACVC